MALEMILKGDEPKNLDKLDIQLDKGQDDKPKQEPERESVDVSDSESVELDDDAINATLDELLGEDAEDDEPVEEVEPKPVKKADSTMVPKSALLTERKKYQAQIEALKAERAQVKGDDIKKLLSDAGYADIAEPLLRLVSEKLNPVLEQQRDLKFTLFAKENPEAETYRDQIIQFASAKDLDYESAWLVIRGKASTRKTSSDMDMEASALAEQKLREKAAMKVDPRPTAVTPTKPKNTPKLTPAQSQLAKKANMTESEYARFMNSVSWADGNRLARERKAHT